MMVDGVWMWEMKKGRGREVSFLLLFDEFDTSAEERRQGRGEAKQRRKGGKPAAFLPPLATATGRRTSGQRS